MYLCVAKKPTRLKNERKCKKLIQRFWLRQNDEQNQTQKPGLYRVFVQACLSFYFYFI
jgi:hypothetical protein